MNGSTDAYSDAARGAPAEPQDREDEQGGFFRRIFEALTPGDDTQAEDGAATAPAVEMGLGNLGRLTVEDVAVPKAEIVAVPVDIDKDELVRVFRESGKTRLPVYEGTLDFAAAMQELK